MTNSPAFKVGRAFLRASLAGEAVAAIGSWGRGPPIRRRSAPADDAGRNAGDRTGGADEGDRLLPAVKLATTLAQNPEDAEVSLQICRDVAARSPKLLQAQLCVGELAVALERKGWPCTPLSGPGAGSQRAASVGDARTVLSRFAWAICWWKSEPQELEAELKKKSRLYEGMRQQFRSNLRRQGWH